MARVNKAASNNIPNLDASSLSHCSPARIILGSTHTKRDEKIDFSAMLEHETSAAYQPTCLAFLYLFWSNFGYFAPFGPIQHGAYGVYVHRMRILHGFRAHAKFQMRSNR